jgi:hypothetical protein
MKKNHLDDKLRALIQKLRKSIFLEYKLNINKAQKLNLRADLIEKLIALLQILNTFRQIGRILVQRNPSLSHGIN